MARPDWRRPSGLVLLGGLTLAVSTSVAFALASGLHTIAPGHSGTFWLPTVDLSFLPDPTANDPSSVDDAVGRSVRGLVYLGVAFVYYLSLVVVALAAAGTALGAARGLATLTRDDARALARTLRRVAAILAGALGDRRVQVGAVALGVVALLLTSSIGSLLLEAVLVVLVSAFGVVLLGSLALALLRHGSPLTDVFALPPLVIATVLLPPIVAGLLAPTLRPLVREASLVVAVWVLDNLLFVAGVNAVLRRSFQLEGVNYVLMWAGIFLAVGWVAGTALAVRRRLGRPSRR